MNRFFPPRPGVTLYHPFLSQYSDQIWMAQRKFKGQRSPIYISKDKKTIELWSRHSENDFLHKNYTTSEKVKQAILSLNLPDSDIVIDAELMHAKTKNLKEILIVYDVLYMDKYLSNVTQMDRLQLLSNFCNNPRELEELKRGLIVNDHIWMAQTIETDFFNQYQSLNHLNEIEGLILRKRNSKLKDGNIALGRRQHEVPWMIRVRKPETNYQF